MAAQIILLKTLAAGGERADGLASVICALVSQGSELGALEDREICGLDGSKRQIKVLPRIWLERLDRAVAVGAFDRLSAQVIVERILAPPLPENVES
jgi:hypothetical protein